MAYNFLTQTNTNNHNNQLMSGLDNTNADENSYLLFTKISAVVLIAGITIFFGFLPIMFQACRRNVKLLGLANAFSGGLFMGIALFHLLPESSEKFEEYFTTYDPESVWSKLPTNYFIAFLAYSLILFLEKIAFDSHSLTEHKHGGHDIHHKDHDLSKPLIDKDSSSNDSWKDSPHSQELAKVGKLDHIGAEKIENEQDLNRLSSFNLPPQRNRNTTAPVINKPYIPVEYEEDKYDNIDNVHNGNNFNKFVSDKNQHRHHHHHLNHYFGSESDDENSDIEEETLKNVVSSKGKFASYLQARNILQEPLMKNPDKALLQASRILHRTRRCNSADKECMKHYLYENLLKGAKNKQSHDKHKEMEIQKEVEEPAHHFHPKSRFAPYLLLIALSIHGLFEGTALGVQRNLKEAVFLTIAIIAHKWAESFSLGIAFYQSKTKKSSYVNMIILFAAFTPIGILSGMLLVYASPILEGTFLAISSGTFLYVSASEVIVEEFAITRYRYQKYFLYLVGGVFVGLLSYLEAVKK